MRLADFILDNIEPILAEWETFARSLAPGKVMTKLALRNDAGTILAATAADMRIAQSADQRLNKSRGLGGAGGEESEQLDHASQSHGVSRVGSGFDIVEVVSEYRALRASVLRLWGESLPDPDQNDLDDIMRFNESLDQSLARAVDSYTSRVEQARRMFLAILSHDLRNPLTCIRMAAFAVKRKNGDADTGKAMTQIETETEAITRLITDLIDFASSGLGDGMPLKCGPVNLHELCQEVVAGFRFAHPTRTLRLDCDEEVVGEWDAGRLRQVVTNLLGNAVQHGSKEGPIELTMKGEWTGTGEAKTQAGGDRNGGVNGNGKGGASGDRKGGELRGELRGVTIRVRNDGQPIPAERLATLFDPLARYHDHGDGDRHEPGSIGLGLYIVREIVLAHRGSIDVDSTDAVGTTFTVRLPMRCPG